MEDFKGIDVIEMAKELHRIYEIESISSNWETQKKCKVPFDKLPKENKRVMLRTCARIIEWINHKKQHGE